MKKAKTIAISAFLLILVLLNIKDMGKLQDLTGKSFGQIKVLSLHGRTGSGLTLKIHWLCKCQKCGFEFTRITAAIKRCKIGCIPCMFEKQKTHGMYKSPVYDVWQGIKDRCLNQNSDSYYLYGGRGIGICPSWAVSFKSFIDDMGDRPSKKHSIDRINNNGDYQKSNCRWVTMQEQANNRRTNVYLEFNGETLTQKQWCQRLGLKENTVKYRIFTKGMSVSEAFTKPVNSPRRKSKNYEV